MSEPGKGSEFIVILPIDISYFDESEIDIPLNRDEQEVTVDMPMPENEGAVTGVKRKSPCSVGCGRQCEILQLIHRLLNRDYHVLTATNGKEAMLILEHEKIDIIVSDIMMPEMDGVELVQIAEEQY